MSKQEIHLDAEQRKALETYRKKDTNSERLKKRAQVVLALDRSGKKDHMRITRIGKEAGLSRQSVYDIWDAFVASETVESFLMRKKRESPPVPAKVTGEVEAQIIALACSEPPEGCARWTVRLIASKTMELKIGGDEGLKKSTVGRVLKKRNLSPI